jgi:hypothetical protein
MTEFDWDNFGVPGSTLSKQYSLDGYNHVW